MKVANSLTKHLESISIPAAVHIFTLFLCRRWNKHFHAFLVSTLDGDKVVISTFRLPLPLGEDLLDTDLNAVVKTDISLPVSRIEPLQSSSWHLPLVTELS
jgi:hypothetical protein